MTEWDYNKKTDDLISLTNKHHKEFLDSVEKRYAIYDAKKQKIIRQG